MKIESREQMFGNTKKELIHAVGGHEPDFSIIDRGFDNPNGVAIKFCSGCGLYSDLTEGQAVEFEQKALQKRPKHTNKFLFVVKGCACCDGDRNHAKIITQQ
ncbi:MAG: hypothetical protein U9R06_00515 [Patescibacteria group bacterium]|nr:hypothetical protein [Patescibacteria group bacterium]